MIPGLTNKSGEGNKENQKKLIMQEISSKYTPNYKVNHVNEDGQDKIQYVFEVPEEKSAKGIDMDIRCDQIKLNSAK